MFDFLAVLIFFGISLFLVVIIIVVYFCVKGGTCCRNKSKKLETGEDIVDLVGDAESDNDSYFNKSYLMPRPVYRHLRNEPDFDNQNPEIHEETSSNYLKPTKKFAESVKSYATGYTSPEEDTGGGDIDDTDNFKLLSTHRVKKNEHRRYVEGTRVRLSLLYSKSDFFLMLTVNEVEGVPNKEDGGGFDYVRVAVTLFPNKKYRSKTKYVFIKESKANFDESFKFSNVTRESLFSSAFRIRLHGKKKIGKEACLGEAMVQLADVAQRAGGFMTWRTFEKFKR